MKGVEPSLSVYSTLFLCRWDTSTSWYGQRDSNPHLTGLKPDVSSLIGLCPQELEEGGVIETRACAPQVFKTCLPPLAAPSIGTVGGTRTLKPKHWCLKPACIPIPPRLHGATGVNRTLASGFANRRLILQQWQVGVSRRNRTFPNGVEAHCSDPQLETWCHRKELNLRYSGRSQVT